MTKNPKWTRDEIILALHLYLSAGRGQFYDSDKDIIELSSLLGKLPIHPPQIRNEQFRNPNGVAMKMANLQHIDPNYHGPGLSGGSHLEKEIWDEFSGNPTLLHKVARSIKEKYSLIPDEPRIGNNNITDEEEFVEGRILTRLHKQIERNSKLVKRKKEKTLAETGKLVCEACQFDFFQVYGELGKGFAECHHKLPLAELGDADLQKTKLSDLAIVCANCHRMLHRGKRVMSIEDLKAIIARNKAPQNKPKQSGGSH